MHIFHAYMFSYVSVFSLRWYFHPAFLNSIPSSTEAIFLWSISSSISNSMFLLLVLHNEHERLRYSDGDHHEVDDDGDKKQIYIYNAMTMSTSIR